MEAAAKEVAVLELPLGDAAETFSLEKAVCSHGLFMMAPNRWDPLTRTFSRPLRLIADLEGDASLSVMVRISHHSRALQVLVYGHSALSPEHESSLMHQVRRMLRLTENDESNMRGFRKMCEEMRASEVVRNFGGRVFRSPTLFEDMVKCILLCNCQWSRTLDMALALCELQLELQHSSSNLSGSEASVKVAETAEAKTEGFFPKTPSLKEAKRKRVRRMSGTNLSGKFTDIEQDLKVDVTTKIEGVENVENGSCLQETDRYASNSSSTNNGFIESGNQRSCQTLNESCEVDHCFDKIGNFPSARELATLDESFLAKRCNLGYRASRILKLSQGIVKGKIQLRQLEEMCDTQNFSSYAELMEQLKEIDGFGPFTCANVLMCMGFYHAIPTDSETIRHLKQVHAKSSSLQTIQRDVEEIYGQYAPFQFLTYWAEIWNFYEQTFGKLSAMPYSDYRLITASNMRTKKGCRNKRSKPI
ncbi:hypothetical protein CRG98_004720 [Punica granatum]|nr:hypothetical protein CRG98_004720 [Punica granatum]